MYFPVTVFLKKPYCGFLKTPVLPRPSTLSSQEQVMLLSGSVASVCFMSVCFLILALTTVSWQQWVYLCVFFPPMLPIHHYPVSTLFYTPWTVGSGTCCSVLEGNHFACPLYSFSAQASTSGLLLISSEQGSSNACEYEFSSLGSWQHESLFYLLSC